MTPEKLTIRVSVERIGDEPVFRMQATPDLVNQLSDELQAQKASWGAVGSDNSQVVGEILFTVTALISGAGGITAVIRAMTNFLRRHDGKEITAHIGQGEGKPVTLEGYPEKDVVELLRLAIEAAKEDTSSPPARKQVESSAEAAEGIST